MYGSVILWEGTNTFTNVTHPRTWDANYPGQHLHVYPLEMHVVDRNNNYVEGATVIIGQSEGKESHNFITYDSYGDNPSAGNTGNVRDCLNDNPVFVYREETSAGVYTNWSDSIEDGRYHKITIFKPGYKMWTRDITFDQNRYIKAILEEEGKKLSLPIAY